MLTLYMKEARNEIDNVIENYLSDLNKPYIISQGMAYSVLNGGKRIRPILLFMTLDLLGKERKLGYGPASAIEFIHSYSLVHDDLPALDNDDYRRGQLTTHKKFGEAEAILIGDALLTHAFSILTEKTTDISPEKVLRIIQKTAEYSGINGMLGGQAVDISSEGKAIDFETLKYIHRNKTGKLISLPIEIGCILADIDNEKYDVLKKFGELIGLAFQIRDDILDVEGNFNELGKTIGSDIAMEKSTYPSIFGMARAKEILNETCEKAVSLIKDNFKTENAKLLIELTEYIGKRNS